jgi:glycosyltransferase involved in cell wall biosynthesis
MLAADMTTVAFLSFRFGALDGVSVVARQWMAIFADLGFEVRTIAGEGTADLIVAGLAIDAEVPPTEGELREALDGVDLTVVENLATIPLNVPAARVVGAVLAGRPAILHHHDPPWHRERFAHITELPLDDPAWRHVVITSETAAEMAARGFETVLIPNGFEPLGAGDRSGQRRALGVADDELLLAHPVRAIERKNVPAAIALAERTGATYWLLGPAEEGYGPTLEALLAGASCRVIHQPCDRPADLYAASDGVAFPSLWEGFGNPPLEAALARRPCAVGHYPFAAELRSLGFWFVEPDDAQAMRQAMSCPDADRLERNAALVEEHFSLTRVRRGICELLESAGWLR